LDHTRQPQEPQLGLQERRYLRQLKKNQLIATYNGYGKKKFIAIRRKLDFFDHREKSQTP
jgi:hypothetical protein